MFDVAAASPSPEMMAPPATLLRVGLMVDSLDQPAWIRRTIEEIATSTCATLVLVVVRADDASAVRRRGFSLSQWKYLLFAAYERFDRRWFHDGRLDPFERTSIAPLVAGVNRVQETMMAPAGGDLSPGTIADIRAHDLDVMLRFGFGTMREAPLGMAKHGIWSIDAKPEFDTVQPLGGFWEVMHGSPITESTLEMEPAGGGTRRIIYRSYGSTSPVSVWKTRRERYWKVASFVGRKLRDLSEQGDAGIIAVPSAQPQSVGGQNAARPSNSRLLAMLPRVAARYAALQIGRKACFDQWSVAYNFSVREPAEPGVPETAFGHFRLLTPPRDRLWADPFPVFHRGNYYLFLEEMYFAQNKGHISVVQFENGHALQPELALDTPHHLSYPFVLQWRGEMFLIPESARAGDSPTERAQLSIPVFRARDFPHDWVQEAAMLENLEVFDPTLAEIDGRWWLFCTRGELGASSWDELHLFHGPTPFGPWTAHRRNPVKSDVRSARPAGRLYRRGGEWYRPAQDCSVRYGYGMSINRITRLTPTEYEEVVVEHIAPDWTRGLIGTHTLNAAGRLTVVDGIRRRARWSADAAPLPRRHPTAADPGR